MVLPQVLSTLSKFEWWGPALFTWKNSTPALQPSHHLSHASSILSFITEVFYSFYWFEETFQLLFISPHAFVLRICSALYLFKMPMDERNEKWAW